MIHIRTKSVMTLLIWFIGFLASIGVSATQNNEFLIIPIEVFAIESNKPEPLETPVDPLFAISVESVSKQLQGYEPVIYPVDVLTIEFNQVASPEYEKSESSLTISREVGSKRSQTYESVIISSNILSGTYQELDPASYTISVESVLHQRREKKLLLIDIRQKSEFEQFRIPGSINIPLFAIKTKPFLKSKSLVLVDEGYTPCQLEQACEQLRKSGFEVWFLNGGLVAWKAQGAALEGDVFAQQTLNRIPPLMFFAEQGDKHWIVIDTSASENPQAQSLFPQAISIPYKSNDEEFMYTFERIIAKYQENHEQQSSLSVLLYNVQGVHYDTIEKVVQKTDIQNVFFLKGGLEAYKKSLDQQTVISQAKGDSRTMLKKCPCCP